MPTASTAGLLVFYNFTSRDGDGIKFADLTPNGTNDGAITGTPSVTTGTVSNSHF